jgi:hypothetical protein
MRICAAPVYKLLALYPDTNQSLCQLRTYRCAAPESIDPPRYLVRNTGGNFFLLSVPRSFEEAEQACQMHGGHLATYTSQLEQQEVEKFYTEGGYWFPTNFKFYWLGLKATNWPSFAWVDKMFPPPTARSYRNWGSFVEPGKMPVAEPFYATGTPPTMCAGGNFTQSIAGVFGWADTTCTDMYQAICRVQREWRR